MAIKDVLKLFSQGLFSSPLGNVTGGERFRVNQLVGQLAPFIGNDNKSQFIKDFEKVKYAYAVISFIAQKAAKVPTVLFQLKGKGKKEQILENLLLGIINNRPNNYQTAYQFKYQFYGYYGATGEAYIYAPKLSSGRWQSMHIIPSDHIDPIYEQRFEGPSGYLINDTGQVIPKEEIIYVRNEAFDLVETGVGYKGLSPMKSLMTVLKKTADIDTADLASIQNGGVMGILADKTRQDEFGNTAWNEDQVGIVEKTMREKAYGPANKGKWLVTSGDVSWIPIGASPIDLNLFESDKKVLQDICIAFHIPYMIFRQEDSNQSFGTAMKEAKKAAYEDAILTWVESFHDSLNHFGIEGFGRNIIADYDTSGIAELQGDEKLKADKLAVEWWKTVGQKQRESGMEVDPAMEGKYLIPNNLIDPNDVDFGNEMAAFENNR